MIYFYPKNVHCEKLEGFFDVSISKENKFFNNLAIFLFEPICVSTEELKETQNTIWMGKM